MNQWLTYHNDDQSAIEDLQALLENFYQAYFSLYKGYQVLQVELNA